MVIKNDCLSSYAYAIDSADDIISSHGINQVLGDSVISVIPVGSFPQALVFNPSNNNIYVTNRDTGTVSVIETNNNTVIKALPLVHLLMR